MSKLITCLLVISAFMNTSLRASPFSWADSLGGHGSGVGRSIAVDLDNNSYVCGQLNGSFQPGNIKTSGNTGFLIKYNSEGSVIWAVTLPGLMCKGLSLDVYQYPSVAGYFSDTVHIEKYTFISSGKRDFFMIKFDSLGNIIWANHAGGPGNDEILSVSNNLAGNTFVTGSFENYLNFDKNNSILSLGKSDFFVAEYDSTGKFVWGASGGGNGEDAGTAIAVDLIGNIFVTGYFNGLATFHNNTLQSKGGKDIFIVKYDSLGYQLVVRAAGGTGEDIANAMSLDGSGNVFIAGTYNGTTDFGGKTLTSNADDGFLAAYTNDLNINWIKTVGGPGDDAALGIKADWQSNVFITGVFTGKANIGNNSFNSEGLTDIFVAKYDAAGRFLWAERAGGPGADSAFSVSNDYNDIGYICGTIYDKADFGDNMLDADSGGSFFISKLQFNPADIQDIIINSPGFDIYPNPAHGEFRIEGLNLSEKMATLQIIDITGKVMMEKLFQKGNFDVVDIHNLPDGIYFITVETLSGIYSQKIVKSGT